MSHTPPGRSAAHDHRPKRSLGQNFLVDPNLQRKIVEALEPEPSDEVIEIGPGHGALTGFLVGRVRRLVLIELDDQLAAALEDRFRNDPSVLVLHRDVLEVDLVGIAEDPAHAKVIGNIPYNITTPIVFHLLGSRPRPARIVLMVQREVADRIVAPPGSKTYGALAVGVQTVAGVQRVLQVPRGAFRPAPDVDSTVLRITPHSPPRLDAELELSLRTLTRAAFGHRRKQFQRILRDALGLTAPELDRVQADTRFDLRARPETFSPAEFVSLAATLRKLGRLPSSGAEPPPEQVD